MSPAQSRTRTAIACALLFVVGAALLPSSALAVQTPAFAAADIDVAQGNVVTLEVDSSPTLLSVWPPNNSTRVLPTATVNARFAGALNATTVTGANFTLSDGVNPPVDAAVSYDAGARRVILNPVNTLAYATTYTARLVGGEGGITDAAGNPLAADYTWIFTTAAPPGPPPTQGPGGPILVISDATRPFSTYYAEILRAEGLNLFAVQEINTLNAGVLAAYQVAIVGEVEVSPAQAAMLSAWVDAGGNLIAMRPDADLLPLLGLTAAGGTLAQGYFRVDTTASPGAGIVGETMQFHGTADRYALNGARAVAMLYSDATTATTNPAVTLHSVGAGGGQVAAFAFDLARSVVQTRQGNPAWAGQERDGAAPIRSNDMFFGPAAADPQPDWVDFTKIAIPQADEAQRLLANLITSMNANQMPLPRFWYFPRGEKAVVVMTHDDHGGGDIVGRLTSHNAASPPDCVVEDWTCVRSTIYPYNFSQITDAQLAAFQGHEFAVHVNTQCLDFTPESLATAYADSIADFAMKFPSAGEPLTQRTHCVAFSDWASQPLTELANGIRLDTNYYYWPEPWILDRPGLFTGSGMPMRFANVDGTMIDVYQAATQMTDESGQSYPATINALLNRALGTEGYYGAFVSNQHTEGGSSGANVERIVTAALARDVPIISARQLLAWVDGRNSSSFANLSYTGNVLNFTINAGSGANGLMAMLPHRNATHLLTALTRSGTPVGYTLSTVKGVVYAQFAAVPGAYVATYVDDTVPPTVTAFAPANGATAVPTTAVVSATFSEPINVDTLTAAFVLRDGANNVIPASLTYDTGTRTATLDPTSNLAYATTYQATVAGSVTDLSDNALGAPVTWSFTTAQAPPGDDTLADFSAGAVGACYLAEDANGEIILAPAVGTEFSATTLPTGWDSALWQAGGTTTFNGAVARVDDAIIATHDTIYGPGRALDFEATFSNANYQHVGFGVNVYDVLYWAMFSTGGTGQGLYARTNNNGAEVNTLLGNSYIGAPHRYRIEWGAAQVGFYIDGALVHTQPVAITRTMRPLISDSNSSGPAVVVDWLHMSPYASSCTFTSRVIAATAKMDWLQLSSTGDRPAPTGVAFFTRTGDSAVPDGGWSVWQPVGADGAVASPDGRYIQYQAVLSTTNLDVTPEVASVTITNAPADLPPVANDLNVATAEDMAVAVTLNAVDPEAGALTYTVTQPGHGTLSGDAPNLTYTPAPNYSGSDSFTYTANDGKSNSNTATVNITVTPVNDAPVLAPIGDQSSVEGATINLATSALDVEGHTLTFSATGLPPLLSINSASGAITGDLTFAAAANSPYAVTVSVSDGQGGTDSETFNWTITDFNRAPVATNLNLTTAEDTPIDITLVATDADDDGLTYTVTQPGHGALSGSGTNRTYTPAPNYNGPDSFTYTANDGKADSNVATVSINVTAVSDAPVLAPIGDQSSVEGATVTLQLSASDGDGNPLTYNVVGLPPGLTYSASTGAIGGQISYTAAAGSPWSVTATVSDGTGNSDSESFTWTVAEILPPRFALPTLSGVHGSTINVPLAFTEATDFGGLRFAVRYDPAVLTPVAVTSTGAGVGWNVTPNLTESGVVTVAMATVNAINGDGTLVNLSFTVAGGPGATSALTFGQVTANGEDVPAARLTNGSFSVPLAGVSGAVRFWSGNGAVAGATLTLAGSATRTTASATDGAFNFAGVAGGAWTLTPTKADGVRGISALDASLVLQSRVGLHTLTPAEALAADINESGGVDENDAIAILRVAVRLDTLPLSPGAHVWRFMPAARSYSPLLADQTNQDFSAVLLGDVTGSWTPPAGVAADATLDTAADAGAVANADAATLTIVSIAAPDGDFDLLFTLTPAAAPVHAVDLLLQYDTARLEIISAQVAQEAGQMAAVNLSQAGVARMALASTTPLPGGRLVATVRVRASGDPLAALLKVEATGDERPIQVVYWAQSPVRIFLPRVDK